MERRRLAGLEVSAVGLGCATMTPFYDEPDENVAIDTLRRSREFEKRSAFRHNGWRPVYGHSSYGNYGDSILIPAVARCARHRVSNK
jgi:hypothetical protein